MQGMLEELRESLTWFTQHQRREYAMLVACDDGDVPMVLSALEGFEDTDPEHMYLLFAHETRTPRAYVDVMIELLRMRLRFIDDIRKAQGDEPFPPIPPLGLDTDAPAARRVQALLTWWRSGLRDAEQIVVAAFVPTAIPSPEVYRTIMLPLLLGDVTQRWTHHTRLLIRDRRTEPLLGPDVAEHNPGNVMGMTADFSPQACEEGLAADAANSARDERSRAMAMLQMAAMDFAQRRHAEAITKYGQLGNVFSKLGDQAALSLCLVGCGDVLRQVERYDEARSRYGQGIEIAARADAKPVVLNGMIGLAETAMAVEEYAAAEKAWDGAARVAGAMRMEMPVADMVEQVGVARLRQRDSKGAWIIWERALEYLEDDARTAPYRTREISILERMVDLASKEGWSDFGSRSRRRLAVARQRHKSEGGA